MDIKDRLASVLDLTERLADLIEVENEALAERRHRDVEAMIEDKAVLARQYENGMRALEETSFDWSTLEPELREKMAATGERLRIAADENAMRLEVGIAANKQVIDMFAEAVRANIPHSGTYSKKGRTGREGTTASANSLSVALDQTL